jgi:hypothetical protein
MRKIERRLSMNLQAIPLIIKDLCRLGFMVPIHALKKKEGSP